MVHLGGGVVEATLRRVQTSRAGAVKKPHLTTEDHSSDPHVNTFSHIMEELGDDRESRRCII